MARSRHLIVKAESRKHLRAILRVFLEEFRHEIYFAFIDAVSDSTAIPPEAQRGLSQLRALATEQIDGTSEGFNQTSRKGIELDLRKPSHRAILLDFGPYSINCELFSIHSNDPVFVMEDSGVGVGWDLNDADFRRMKKALAEEGIPLDGTVSSA